MVSNVLEIDQEELVKLLQSFRARYAGDAEWNAVRAGFPKTWPI